MKKILMAAAAITLMMTMTVLTACTSDIDDNPVTPNSSGKDYVHIELQCDLGEEAETAAVTRSTFNRTSLAVKFTNGDVLFVGNGGRYIGKLTYRDGLFTGDIFEPTTNDYLHLYFLGNKKPENMKDGETTALTLDISDQKKELPFLAYGKSHIKYSGPRQIYICLMKCLCGLVEFNVVDDTDADIQLLDMHVNAHIDFSNPDNPISTAEGTGAITLFYENGNKRYAVAMPQDSLNTLAVIGGAQSKVSLPAIEANKAVASENARTINPKYYFSVGPDKKVVISPGDLRYRYNNGDEWCFASPWDNAIGTPDDPTRWKDEFEFWGWDNNAPSSYNVPQYVTFRPTINNYSNWRILSDNEWNYLLGDSPERKDKWCIGIVHDKTCLIVFPDTYDGEQTYTPGLCTYNNNEIGFWNKYLDWDSNIRHGAAVFPIGWEKHYEHYSAYSYTTWYSGYYYWTYCYDTSYWNPSHRHYFKPAYFYIWPWSWSAGGIRMGYIPDSGVYNSSWSDRNHVRLVREWN